MGVKTTTAITTVKRDIQLREWTEQIKAQQERGMTVTAFCAQNDINPKTYYNHLRKVNPKIKTDTNEKALHQATWRAFFLIFIAANLSLTHLRTWERPLTSV